MYFNEKSDTDINKEINQKKKKSNRIKKNKFILIMLMFFVIFIVSLILINGSDNKEYFLEIFGDNVVTIYQGSEYIEDNNSYKAYDSDGNDLTSEVSIYDNIDTSTIGEYVVVYSLQDLMMERYIKVIEKPKIATYIHLKGEEVVYLSVNEEYIDPGYTAIDTVDSNLTKKVKVTNNIDNTKAGIYKVTYSVTNSSGVTSSAVRKVIVMDSEVSLSLSNSNPTNSSVNINIHITDNYYSYLILPNGEKITNKDYSYKVSSNGEYKFVIYNTKGKSVTKSISVTNIDKEAPNGTCSYSIENGKTNITVVANDNFGISKYVSNGVSSINGSIVLNNLISNPVVNLYDTAGNTSSINCTSVSTETVQVGTKEDSAWITDFHVSTITNRTFQIYNQTQLTKSDRSYVDKCNRVATLVIVSGYSTDNAVTAKNKIDNSERESVIQVSSYWDSYGLKKNELGSFSSGKYEKKLASILKDGGYALVWLYIGGSPYYGKSGTKWTSKMHWVSIIDYKVENGKEKIYIASGGKSKWYDIDEFKYGVNRLIEISEK